MAAAGMLVGFLGDEDGQDIVIVWVVFAVMTCCHIFANYCGLRACILSTPNQQRAQILVEQAILEMPASSDLLSKPVAGGSWAALTPLEVSRLERIVDPQVFLPPLYRSVALGCHMDDLMGAAWVGTKRDLNKIVLHHMDAGHKFMVSFNGLSRARVALAEGANTSDMAMALLYVALVRGAFGSDDGQRCLASSTSPDAFLAQASAEAALRLSEAVGEGLLQRWEKSGWVLNQESMSSGSARYSVQI
jgi:hypothetical protein